jgi:hypothetical protein
MSGGGCNPFWISPYTFVGMRNAIVGSQPFDLVNISAADDVPFSLVNASAADDDSDEYLHLIVRVHQDGDVEFVSAFHLPGPSPVSDPGPISSITCELIGANGEVVESGRLYEELLQRPGGPYTQYFGTLPWDPSVQAIVLTRNAEELYRHRVEETAPRVQLSALESREENGEQLHVEWTGDVSGDVPLTYIPRYSNDDGKTWQALGPAQAETSYELDLNAVPGGERCRFQVVASSAIRTSVITSDPFTVPVKLTTAQILSPVDGTEIQEGERLLLYGRAFSPDFGTTPSEEMLWFSDLDGLVATGHETWTTNLSQGRHQLTLRVPDGLDGESEDAVTIQVAAAT